MSANARAFVEREHALPRVADQYAAALEEAAGGATVGDAVVAELAEAAAATGIEPESEDMRELAARLREARIVE